MKPEASGTDGAQVWRALRRRVTKARRCHELGLKQNPTSSGSVRVAVTLNERGRVRDARMVRNGTGNAALAQCLLAALRTTNLPKPEGGGTGSFTVEYRFELDATPRPAPRPTVTRPRQPARPSRSKRPKPLAKPRIEDAYTGGLAEVLGQIRKGSEAAALDRARAFQADDPGDVMALIALGEALEAGKHFTRAARVYGSIIDLYPSRADMRRMAGARLERLPGPPSPLVVDTYRRALQQRPDHPSGHRLLAFALLRGGQHEEAFATFESALARSFREDRFPGVERILREDLGLVAAAWLATDPSRAEGLRARLTQTGASLAEKPSLRFVLNWETDANDVDFHIHDSRGGHAYYMRPRLPSGGRLYADIINGYGPECFAVDGPRRRYPYTLQAHYFSRGPMGYGMGKLQVIEHDGKGHLGFAEHPFVIMKDKAFIELAVVEHSLLQPPSPR